MAHPFVTLVCLLSLIAQPALAQDSFPVSIQVDAATSNGELHRIWRYFGADEPNYAYMKDGRKLLGQLGELASKLATLGEAEPLVIDQGIGKLSYKLPRQGVSLVVLEYQ